MEENNTPQAPETPQAAPVAEQPAQPAATVQEAAPQPTAQQPAAPTPASKKLPGDEILFGALSYFTVAVLATIVSKPHSEFCKFHARQGVMLVILDLLLMVFMTIALAIVPFLAYIIFFIGVLVMFGLHVLGLVNAVQGKMYKLPVIYGLAQKVDLAKAFTPSKPTKENEVQKAVHNVEAEKAAEQAPQSAPQPAEPTTPAQPQGQDMVGRAVEGMKEERHDQQQ